MKKLNGFLIGNKQNDSNIFPNGDWVFINKSDDASELKPRRI